jgi:hypothetical protein
LDPVVVDIIVVIIKLLLLFVRVCGAKQSAAEERVGGGWRSKIGICDDPESTGVQKNRQTQQLTELKQVPLTRNDDSQQQKLDGREQPAK